MSRVSSRVLSIDPGMETGLVVLSLTDAGEFVIEDRWQVQGGLDALERDLCDMNQPKPRAINVVCERFRTTPRTYKADEIEALRIEGLVKAYWPDVTWQYNDQLLLAGASHGSRGKNKTAADNVLRHLGLWSTGTQIGAKDANDVNSAMKHAVAYLRNQGEQAVIDKIHEAVGL